MGDLSVCFPLDALGRVGLPIDPNVESHTQYSLEYRVHLLLS